MQITSIAQPTEVQSPDFKHLDSRTVEKVENNKPDHKEFSSPNKAEQNEKFHELQSALAEHNITLNFSRDIQTNELVVKMIDDKTGEALQQFPTEVSLKLAATFAKLQGQFVDGKY